MRPSGVFRPDIEGLRAFLILAAILYHAGVPGFASGYLAIDAFYVISGFLITGLLVREAERDGRVRLLRFWGRRAARLLPNALLTLVVTMLLIMAFSPVLEHEAGARDIASALLYFANYHFSARAIDYFDQTVQASPVLHFWSLSLEEQFYIFWPICIALGLWAFKRFNRPVTLLFLAAIIVGSFGAMMHWTAVEPSRAYFDTESRAWDMAVGAVFAVWRPPAGCYATAIGWGGLAVLLTSIALVDHFPIDPHVATLLPTLSGAAMLYGGALSPAFATNRLLGNPVMQWIGARSYSLYLWHWPVLVFVTPVFGHWAGFAAIVIVAAVAYALVENPLRHALPNRIAAPKLVWMGMATSAATAALVFALPPLDPAYSSARAAFLKQLVAAKDDGPRMIGPHCKTQEAADSGVCVFGVPGGAHRVAVFGDSHAEQLFDGINAAAVAAGWEFRVWARGGCSPIDFETNDEACTRFHSRVYDEMARYKPDLILVASGNGGAVHLHDKVTGKEIPAAQSVPIWKAGFQRALERLKTLAPRVVVVRDTPINTKAMGTECLETRAPETCLTPRSDALLADPPDVAVARMVPGIAVVDLSDRFCDARFCPAIKDGRIMFRMDNNHITATISLGLAPDFERVLHDGRQEAANPTGR
jgi:peptidoglycan/LPS O-acetylase OafA/YrhL